MKVAYSAFKGAPVATVMCRLIKLLCFQRVPNSDGLMCKYSAFERGTQKPLQCIVEALCFEREPTATAMRNLSTLFSKELSRVTVMGSLSILLPKGPQQQPCASERFFPGEDQLGIFLKFSYGGAKSGEI